MGTPQAVLDAEAEADRMIAGLAGGGTPEAGKDDSALTPEAASDKSEEPREAAPQQREEAAAQPDTSSDARIAELQERLTKLQAQYDTLRGKTYAEVPRVISENKQLRDRIAELETKIAAIGSGESRSVAPSGKASEILAKIKEDVSEDVADNINKLVNAIVEERVGEKIKAVESNIENVRRSSTEAAEDRYLARLTELVPDWRAIANSPEYSEFLATPDEMSGITYYDMARRALEALDAEHMARFYNKYKAKTGKAVAPVQKPAAVKNVSGKEALVEAGGVVAQNRTDAGSEKPDYITVKQMEQFNRDRREKRLTEKQELEMEARLDRAIAKGWIVP